ncbi:MAG TPA: diaminopimelate epimerase [Candidatus Ornithomonoglobus intestinigallinarum]|uniref:Diaminopimelate epimerase n=1 Tax=Candidatus Ornithomonoglobus intestinigallinarum TaxID=2840894 RepID=A0A9D1H3G9_9FIRM|nr:diaminopimelate epimerase [Candidatus Ornithomonoglobus intestinigallinarum]
MSFTKMQGAGNDYIYVNCLDKNIENINETAKRLSDRHFGIGSDGLVLICPSDKADFKMEMYNSDGTRAEMCGNASRCVGKYVYDKGLTAKTSVTLETLAGIKTLDLNIKNGSVKSVCVNMGAPELSPVKIPVKSDLDKFISQPVIADGTEYRVTCVSMGNPHAVIFEDEKNGLDIDTFNIEKLGPLFENNPIFPNRTNTEFARILNGGTIKMRVWERGAGETLACGTGACAVLAAASLCGLAGDEADLLLLGGTLHIKWDKTDNNIYMTGPAEFVFDGTVTL